MVETAGVIHAETKDGTDLDAKALANLQASHELIFGIVGHVGSGTSTVAMTLKEVIGGIKVHDMSHECEVIKAREVIEEWATGRGMVFPSQRPFSISDVENFQDLGDEMRRSLEGKGDSADHAAVARGAIVKIRHLRAQMQKVDVIKGEPVVPDGSPRAFIIDSIRHPAEVELLRRVYGDAFVLLGVVCQEQERKSRISQKYRDAGLDAAEKFMDRDSKADEKHGQRVSDAFHLSDFFIDNTAPRFEDDERKTANPAWEINDHLNRLIRVVTHEQIERPHIDETAMFAAAGAAMRSACLSRQVGAALLDARSNVVATGANEVPRAGGGVYGEQFGEDPHDDRCFLNRRFCSNTREQTTIASAIIAELEVHLKGDIDQTSLIGKLKSGRVGELLEFSRAVHAEMDALLAAGRKGTSTIGCRLYVTTFPCHYCARHIVSAGVDKVLYIEPYPKSKAFALHGDSIQNDDSKGDWVPPSTGGEKVLFVPFTGVAPRMYRRAFEKDRELKVKSDGSMNVQPAEWGSPYDISKTSYAEFEVALTRGFGE